MTYFLLIIILVLLLGLSAVIFYFFSIAFVKHNFGDTDDMDDPSNSTLQEYRDVIEGGIRFIRTAPHKWVYIKSFDGLRLAARYYDNGSKSTIILMHGYRSSAARDFSCAVKMYLDFGFNVLLCDQRSHGKSEGRLITFGVKERFDAKDWAQYAINELGAESIVISGLSMGATTALLSLTLGLPPQVKAIAADCGFTSPTDIITKVAKEQFKINAKYVLPILNLFCWIFGGFSMYACDTVTAVKNSDLPIFFIHGKSDSFVPCEMSERAFAVANEKCRIITVNGAEHGLSFLVDGVLVKTKLLEFYKENDVI